MTDVFQLGAVGSLENMINDGWEIVKPHDFLIKIPKLLRINLKSRMLEPIFSTSVIAEPHIITSPSNLECWRKLWVIDHPDHHITVKTVLEQHRLSNKFTLLDPWDSPERKNIAVFGDNVMLLPFEPILLAEPFH